MEAHANGEPRPAVGAITIFLTGRTMPKARRPRKRNEDVVPKAKLAREIARILEVENLTQTEAAYRVKDAPSQISLMVTGHLRGFSAERLIRTLVGLGRDVSITTRNAKGSTGSVRVMIR
jgi:predicted XRE-type DNA-binding protein